MIWKLLLYPVAFIVDRISNVGIAYFWVFVGDRIKCFILNPLLLLSRKNPIKVIFLGQVLQMFFIRFFTSIGGIMILALWGHKYAWVIFLVYLIIRERRPDAVTDSIGAPWHRPASLIGAWLGLALVAFLTAMYT